MEIDSDDSAHCFSSEIDSGNESSGDEVGIDYRSEPSTSRIEEICDDNCYQVLSVEELFDFMSEEINEVKDVAQLPATTIRLLLNHLRWDKEKLLERLYDGDEQRLFADARIVAPAGSSSTTTTSSKALIRNPSSPEDCEICLCSYPSQHLWGLECGHRFCDGCWLGYLSTKIMTDGQADQLACAAHNCHVLVADEAVARVVAERHDVISRYRHLITNSFVECNRRLCWCPAADCGYALRVRYPEPRAVTCTCGHVFCFSCGEAWHEPVRCQLLRRWLKKCDDDSETLNWIAANTKLCPKCSVIIEKDGGCNHMVCKNQNCRADFCWVCLGPWEPHGSSWYHCNRYDEKDAQSARQNQETSRAALNRYMFYFNRYANHLQSLKFESKLYGSVKHKMTEMQQLNMSWIEVQFLKKAVDILCSCRQTLMYTYAFAYYLRENNQSRMFETNQKDLENSTEMLSEYLERDITQENLVDIKQKVQDKYRYCESRRKALRDHVQEGYEREWWEYMD